MINALFTGTAVVLLCFAAYWVRGRGGHRPTGTWAMAALLTSFALAFASYAPAVERAVESVVPHVARLLSNTFTLTAATAVLAFLFQLNLDRERADRQIRLRVIALAVSVTGMTAFFVAEQLTGRNPVLYACYVLIYISYLGYTAKDFLLQTWAHSKRSTRRSQRWGLRTTSVGCGFALLYAAYKLFALISIGLGLGLIPDHARCSSPLTPFRCAFSVTAPAVAVLLITVGLTLPALLWPLGQLRRRRWERNSFTALEPLWREVTSAVPEVVLDPGTTEVDSHDLDFHLHRRVIEINDCVLALRPYRRTSVRNAAAAEAARRGTAGTPRGEAEVEAAVIAAAVAAKRTGLPLDGDEAPPATGTRSRKGDLPAETAWLLLVAEAYARHPAPENTGAASPSHPGAENAEAALPGRPAPEHAEAASPSHPTPEHAEAPSPSHPTPKNAEAAS
ncbi:MAB_1171c family putative transporter [Streptomyces microflavus]|uniref:MAB_1171c family putative transporter n=1 Tax=Streptomyces microflavus TaxID=1919 RepID=UPI0036B84AB6